MSVTATSPAAADPPANRISAAWIADLFPGIDAPGPLTLNAQILGFRPETLPLLLPYEHLILAALSRLLAPRRILEIGTAQGRGTVLLAANSPDDTAVVTIDLPSDRHDSYTQSCLHGHADVGHLFSGTRWAGKVRQVRADTATLDPASLRAEYGAMDLILVDGDHSYEGVRRDTALAVVMAADDAVILWHDFYLVRDYVADPARRGVYPFLNAWNGGGEWDLHQVMGTYFVAARRRKRGWPAELPTVLLQPGDGGAAFGNRIARLADTAKS